MPLNRSETIENIQREANNWLIGYALPLWCDRGVDWSRGGYLESLDGEKLTCAADFKRLRVLARQIYVFTAGCHLGQAYCRRALMHGLDFLFSKARLSSGGYSSRLNLDGDIIEDDLDLYDLAFCLFALAHSYRLLEDPQLKDEALVLVTFISERLSHFSGGFSEGVPRSLPRRQNPHMHLLEALLEWRSISDHIVFRDMSDALVTLFFNKFYFPATGALIEYFDEDLTPLKDKSGEVTEPGHHFEWVWLFDRYRELSAYSIPRIEPLYNFARGYGINPQVELLWGEVNTSGIPVGSSVRLWPHTEWLKAELVTNSGEHHSRRISQAWTALSRFLDHPQPGLWQETFDHEKNSFVPGPSPASSFYHIVLAIECLNKFQTRYDAR